MVVTAVVGGHWGDEGKGKVVDALAAVADMVIRYNGGNNAGHTIVGPHGTLKLHLVPSGICHPQVDCLIGPGVVVNPTALLDEIAMLHAAGISTARLRVSTRAHLLFPFHVALDEKVEADRGRARTARRSAVSGRSTRTRRRGSASAPVTCSSRPSCGSGCPRSRGGPPRRWDLRSRSMRWKD